MSSNQLTHQEATTTRRRLRLMDHQRPRSSESLHADGVDLDGPALEGGPFDLILYLAIPENLCEDCS
jgi:hypothetical protein